MGDSSNVRELKAFLSELSVLLNVYATNMNITGQAVSGKYAHLSNNDVFYREKMFVLAYMGDSQFTHRASTFKELAEIYDYPLAQYVINLPKERLIDGCQFTGLFFQDS